jgi:hypothetical protein
VSQIELDIMCIITALEHERQSITSWIPHPAVKHRPEEFQNMSLRILSGPRTEEVKRRRRKPHNTRT